MTTYLTNGGALWLSAVLNATARPRLLYSHVLELFAANFVLLVLLVETIALYARRARTIECERAERESRLMRNGDITKPEPVLSRAAQQIARAGDVIERIRRLILRKVTPSSATPPHMLQ